MKLMMVTLFRRAAVETILPPFAGLVKCLLHDVPESPDKARRGKTGEHHHDEFLGKRAGHNSDRSRSPATGGDVLLDFGLRILRNNPNVETSRPSDARHAGREGWFLSQFAGALVQFDASHVKQAPL